MKIYIPSCARDLKVAQGPLRNIPPGILDSVYYVVPPEQQEQYQRALHNTGFHEVNVLACPERGIDRTRHWIGLYAQEDEQDKFLMVDDDIGFLVRKSEAIHNLRTPIYSEIVNMLGWIDFKLDTHAHVAISAREGNSHPGPGTIASLAMENTRTLRVLAYRTKEFLEVEHGRVPVMEDFDVNLQLLERGHKNVCSYWWSQGQRMTNEPGGCSTYRSHELHEKAAYKLAELHPGLVKLREKANKTDRDGFGTRTEVTISWKKAYKHGNL